MQLLIHRPLEAYPEKCHPEEAFSLLILADFSLDFFLIKKALCGLYVYSTLWFTCLSRCLLRSGYSDINKVSSTLFTPCNNLCNQITIR